MPPAPTPASCTTSRPATASDTNVVPAGSVSDSDADAGGVGPLLVTVIV